MANDIQYLGHEIRLKLNERDSGLSLHKKKVILQKNNLPYDDLLHLAAVMSVELEILHLAFNLSMKKIENDQIAALTEVLN